MQKIIIRTERLLLRQFTINDTQKIFKMSLEEGMKEFIPDQVYADELEAVRVLEFLISQYSDDPEPEKAPYVLGIELSETEELIGHVGLSAIDEGVEIGYAVEDKYQGKGCATEAVKAMSEYALNKLYLNGIWGMVDKKNYSSIRVLEKAGYEYCNTDKNKLKYIFKGEL